VAKLTAEKELSKTSIEVGMRAFTSLAKEIDSELEVVFDPTEKVGSSGTVKDFAEYFRDRFEKLSRILRQRLDAKDATSIKNALKASLNERVKIIAMVLEKRESKNKIFLQIDDIESSATLLASPETGKTSKVFETAQRIPLDQVLCVEAIRGRGDLFIAEKLVLPDIPERRIPLADKPVQAVLLSDIHVGSKTFLEKTFSKLILWLNGKVGNSNQVEIASQVKYVVIAGDLVDGVGVYPHQDEDLIVDDVYGQYRLAAKYLEQIPDYIEVVLAPGNHDPVRQALPQPAVAKEYAEPVYEAREIVSVGNPAELKLHGVHLLVYHGRSLDDIIATVPNMSFDTPQEAMKFQLKCRHLAPEYGKRTSIAPERKDYLVVEHPPDVFQSGHIHVAKHDSYRGTLVVNCGTWQAQTEYQKKMGLKPTPGILPVLNLQTMQIRMIDFGY